MQDSPPPPAVPPIYYMSRSWIFSEIANGPPGVRSPARRPSQALSTPLAPVDPPEAMLYA